MNPAENYIINQFEPYRSILLHLHVIIENTIPDAVLQYKYRVPFYYVDGRPFCYLSVNQKNDFVDLGFWNGNYLSINLNYLTIAKRKVIKSLRYKGLEDIEDNILIEILNDAYSVKGKSFGVKH